MNSAAGSGIPAALLAEPECGALLSPLAEVLLAVVEAWPARGAVRSRGPLAATGAEPLRGAFGPKGACPPVVALPA